MNKYNSHLQRATAISSLCLPKRFFSIPMHNYPGCMIPGIAVAVNNLKSWKQMLNIYLHFTMNCTVATKNCSRPKITKCSHMLGWRLILFNSFYLFTWFIWLCQVLVAAHGIQFPDQGSNLSHHHKVNSILTFHKNLPLGEKKPQSSYGRLLINRVNLFFTLIAWLMKGNPGMT